MVKYISDQDYDSIGLNELTHLSEVHGTPAVDLADAPLVGAARGAGGPKVALGCPAWDWGRVSVKSED